MRIFRRIQLAGAIILSITAFGIAAQKPQSAAETLQAAQALARQEHKLVFFIMSASWCGPCHALERFIAAPEVAPILDKYFIVAKINIFEENGKHPELNTPGGKQMLDQYGGPQGVPFFIFFNSKGDALVTSARPVAGQAKGANIGYPDAPEEIEWFMEMLRKSVPEMPGDKLQKIDEWLKKASHFQQPKK